MIRLAYIYAYLHSTGTSGVPDLHMRERQFVYYFYPSLSLSIYQHWICFLTTRGAPPAHTSQLELKATSRNPIMSRPNILNQPSVLLLLMQVRGIAFLNSTRAYNVQ